MIHFTKRDHYWSFFGVRNDPTIRISNFFWWKQAVEVIEAIEVVEAVEVIEAAGVLRPGKSQLGTSESSRFLSSALFWCFEKIFLEGRILKSEAVEASWCYFFKNWWMKLKCPLLLKPLATIVQENSQSFYPSEPFRIYHFTMRHPVLSQKKSHTTSLNLDKVYIECKLF